MFETMNVEQLEARKAAIVTEVDSDGADLDALEKEVRDINAELEARKRTAEERAAKAAEIRRGAGAVIERPAAKEERKKTLEEIRSSKEYIHAFANFVRGRGDREARALLTENAPSNGVLPVPVFLEGYIRANWDRSEILSLVRRSYVRGNLKIMFELSATGAVVHQEGTEAPAEEVLTFGSVLLIPENIKKWITVSDETLTMKDEDFLKYIYDEITREIAKAEAKAIIDNIVAAVGAANTTKPAVGTLSVAPGLDTVIKAEALLSSDAADVTLVMSRATKSLLELAQLAANYPVDAFRGYRIVTTDALPAYDTAGANAAYMIVGDFRGYQENFPEGDTIRIKFDDTTLMTQDLNRILGRLYVGGGVVESNYFTVVTKPAA